MMRKRGVRWFVGAGSVLCCTALIGIAAASASDAKRTATIVRLAHVLQDTHPQHIGAIAFANAIEKNTNGAYKIQIFANGQLGDDLAMQEQLSVGALEMAIPGNTLGAAPRTGVFWLPYMFRNKEHVRHVIGGAIGKEVFADLLPRGLRVLAVFDGGFRQLTNSRRAVRQISDMSGLKLRVPNAPLFLETFKAFGANPTPMGFAELYTALQQGTVDGQENPLTVIFGSRFYEVQKYLTLTNHSITTQPLTISERFWNTLDVKTKKVFQDAALEAQAANYKEVDRQLQTALADLKAKGMQVSAPYSTEFAKLIRAQVWPKFVGTFGQLLMDRVQQVKCKRTKEIITCTG